MENKKVNFYGRQFILYSAVSIFAIFIGSQITEGALLLPYWKSMSSVDFYSYYKQFGPIIGNFYTVLTIIAALIPVVLSIYFKSIGSRSFRLALISSFFAVLMIVSFYIYFKGTNELFYQAALSDIDLERELVTWTYWHWGRVVIEFLSLFFLILSVLKFQAENRD